MSHSCGGCQFFIKWKFDRIGGGLCDAKDARTKTDHGHKCKWWRPIYYNRKRIKKISLEEDMT